MRRSSLFMGIALLLPCSAALASENVPRRPFAMWADLPAEDQLITSTFYEQSESYYIWAGTHRENITIRASDGESYGIDIRQGYFSLDYGITARWAADLELGFTTVGWRSFDPGAAVQQTTGLMDTTLGARYQLCHEAEPQMIIGSDGPTGYTGAEPGPGWVPTLTFRAAAILPGVYDRHLAFAPGNSSVAIEPSLLMRKHLGWPGLGVWADGLYRWMHTTGNNQYIAAFGFFQQIRKWELDVGYRHLQATSGSDIVLTPPAAGNPPPWDGISYKADVREISDSIDAGFSYTHRNLRLTFHARKTFDGSNTDSKLWLGGSVDWAFDHLFGR